MIDLKIRTKKYSLQIIKIVADLPRSSVGRILGNQLLRSATSVGAHYRESLRARSKAEYISKLNGGLQELEESLYWLELIKESGISGDTAAMTEAERETGELTAIFITIIKKTKKIQRSSSG